MTSDTTQPHRASLLEPPEEVPEDTVFADMSGDLAAYTDGDDPLARFDVPVSVSDIPRDVFDIVRAECDDPDEGFFGPDSMVSTVFEERTVFLGVPTGIVLQVAHPKVGQGVGDHGTLSESPIDRLHRTFDAFDAVLFGDVVSAVRAAVIVRTLHERVHGTVDGDAGPFDAGDQYHANDPELLLWVAATLIELPLDTYEAYAGPLSRPEVEQFYEEMQVFGELMGVPADVFPEDYDAFQSYYRETIDSEIVESTAAREVVSGFLDHSPATPLVRYLTSSLLPPGVREPVGLEWGPGRERVHSVSAACLRSLPRSLVPDRVQYRRRVRRYRERDARPET